MAKRNTASANTLIEQAQRLWMAYDKKPTKANLMAFGKHLGVMKQSKSARVQKDRRDGMRAFNAEMKANKWKMPKQNPCLGLHFHKEDAEELLKAAQKVQVKKNPRKRNPDYKQQKLLLMTAGIPISSIKEGADYIRVDSYEDDWVKFYEAVPGRWWWQRYVGDTLVDEDQEHTTFSQAYVNAMLSKR